MKKRVLSLILAICLTVSLFSGMAPKAFAVDDVITGYLARYTVKAGDTISDICAAYNLDMGKNLELISKVNSLPNYNWLMPGMTLWLPVSTVPTSGSYYTLLSHTLVAGEAPAALCQSYGIDYYKSYNLLSSLNPNLNAFMAGTQIIIPLFVNRAEGAVPTTGLAAADATITNGGLSTGMAAGGFASGTGAQAGSDNVNGTGVVNSDAVIANTAGTAGTTNTAGTAAAAAGAAATGISSDVVSFYLAQVVLKNGQTVTGVCAELGVNFDQYSDMITRLNHINNYNNIPAGKTLLIPQNSTPSGSHYRIMAHTIAAGDTALALCNAYGLNYANYEDLLKTLNNRTDLTMLYVGQKFYMPVYVASGTGAVGTAAAVATDALPAAGTGNVTATPAPASVPNAGMAAGGFAGGSGTQAGSGAVNVTTGAGGSAAVTGDVLDHYVAAHTLAAGETVSGVCAELGVDFDTNAERIKQLSNITDFNSLMPGKVILVPTTIQPTKGAYYKIMRHTFVAGETVSGLCTSYGLVYENSVGFLQRLNSRNDMTSFYVGQSIYMPIYVAG